MSHKYDDESISSLKGAERVRLRPGVIFGSDDLSGAQHAFFEILSNSIDESRVGYGKEIIVRRFPDYSIEVEDFGRGIPVDFNKNEKRFNWELVYCELYAGGKYEDGNYEYSLGLNGLGACATQYASKYFDVTVMRDGSKFSLHFENGDNVGGLQKETTRFKRTGTIQRFLLDREVFTDIKIPTTYFEETLNRQAVVNKGLTFIFDDQIENKKQVFFYEEGIKEYVKTFKTENSIIESPLYFEGEGKGKDRGDKDEYKVKAEIALLFDNGANLSEYYHNSSWLEYGGSPDRAVKNAFVFELDRQAKLKDRYKGNESKISFVDIQESLVIVINSFSTQTSYENQTKKAINNKFIQEFLTDLIKTHLEIWFLEQKEDSERLLDQILVNKRSRESAEKQRLSIKKKLMGSIDVTNRVKKFVDCRSKDVEKRELYIVEGDSALGSCKMGRDADFQAVIPVRGKILNCLKSDLTTIFKNEIITDLIKVLGCGVEIKNQKAKDMVAFNLDSLRWNKIIICTDADVDGFQIRTLILAMFYRLLPTLIRSGKIYIAETPLFEITATERKKEHTYFAFNEGEKQEILKKLTQKRIQIQRSKGLGENEPEMMWETTMNPETRRLIQVLPTDEDHMRAHFDMLLGKDDEGRKSYIAEHGQSFIELLDV